MDETSRSSFPLKKPICCVTLTPRHSGVHRHASFLGFSQALHPELFDQPARFEFFSSLLAAGALACPY
ncbi:MAG: hypothetical protein HY801_03080 [Candidatus Lindowbacteria bacterium]|nr:hypothetical protein [Candidatus Lindowbacteria bacterium]